MDADNKRILVSDTSVLVNFLRIDRMDLIADVSYELLVTDHVGEEISTLKRGRGLITYSDKPGRSAKKPLVHR